MALSLLVLSAGCQREEIVSVEQDDVMEVYATIEDVDDVQTKTYLSGTDVYWSSGDKIAVFLGNTLRKRFDVTPESIDSKDATFVQDEDYVQMGKNDNISHNVAYYPFCDVTCAPDGSSYTLSNLALPSTQSYVEGSVGLGAYPMVAVTENTNDVNFCFKNICGVMQFQLKGSGFVKSVSVRGNRGEVLAGSAVVTAGYGKEPSIVMSAEGVKEVTLDCGESGVELNETTPVSFFIVLPPVQFEGGFTITVTDIWGGSKEYSTAKKNSILRSKGLRMPAKEYIGVRQPQEGDYIDEYGVNHGQGIEIDGVVWAPVNCGYKAPTADSKGFPYGKLYQWGRKYGQGYSVEYDESEPVTIKGHVSSEVGQSEENSNNFYYYATYFTNDWITPMNDKIWNTGTEKDPLKTEFDPCPEGWRVPTYSELNKLRQNVSSKTTNDIGVKGCWFSGSKSYATSVPRVFFPLAGQRQGTYGAIIGRGSDGYYWSSIVSDRSQYPYAAQCLYFTSANASMSYSARATGKSVRCVKDKLIPVESITLNQSSLILSIGNSASLSSAIVPANATYKSVYWRSDDTGVATVDVKGNVTAVAEGTTTIIAMAGMQTAQCEVTVVAESVVDMSLSGTANSYIVSQKGAYKFRAVKGNSSESVGAVSSAEVLWETFGTDVTPNVGDLVKNVSYKDGEVTFYTAETFREGNAVIAAKDASGNILWSWHIWLTDEPQGQEYYNNAGTMMDRNLGATSATPGDVGALGLLYQWGRKDPFLGSSSLNSTYSDWHTAKSTITWPSSVDSYYNTGTIEYAIAHPTTYIYYNPNNKDWYYNTGEYTNDSRWKSEKTIYDPCPAGWRVPDGGRDGIWSKALGISNRVLSDDIGFNRGINFFGMLGNDSNIWYPVTTDYGALSLAVGCYWSCTTIGISAYYLHFKPGEYNPAEYDRCRSACFSVRCVQE